MTRRAKRVETEALSLAAKFGGMRCADEKAAAQELAAAVAEHRLGDLARMLKGGADSNTVYEGDTLLTTAIKTGNKLGADLLMRHGADPNHVNQPTEEHDQQCYCTALVYAVRYGDSDQVDMLLAKGAHDKPLPCTSSKCSSGWHKSSNNLLVGALMSGSHARGKRAEQGAVEMQVYRKLLLLLRHRGALGYASFDKWLPEGETVLSFAVQEAMTREVRLLLQYGASPRPGPCSEALLAVAMEMHDPSLVDLLCKYGCEVNDRPDGTSTVLSDCIFKERWAEATLLWWWGARSACVPGDLGEFLAYKIRADSDAAGSPGCPLIDLSNWLRAAHTAVPFHACANELCVNTSRKMSQPFKLCKRCRSARFCSGECHKESWHWRAYGQATRGHDRETCSMLREARMWRRQAQANRTDP